MTESEMFARANALAGAKGRQDILAALDLFDPDMLLVTPAFGTRARGLRENEAVLKRFFATFPDYAGSSSTGGRATARASRAGARPA